jgi:hypothetical protein
MHLLERLFYQRAMFCRYGVRTTAKLTKKLTIALHASGDNELEVVDPETQQAYVVVAADFHRQAMEALRRQQDREAIAQGILEMEAGEGMPVDQAWQLARERLRARKR